MYTAVAFHTLTMSCSRRLYLVPPKDNPQLLAAPLKPVPTPAPNLLSVPFLDFHTNGITQSVTFRVRLPSLKHTVFECHACCITC